MKNIFNEEKNKIIIIIVFQFLISILALLNYSFKNPVIDFDKEILYTAIIVVVIFSNIFYFLSFYNKIDKENSINNIKVNSLILNNLKEVEKFGEVGIIFYNDLLEVIWVNDFLDSRRINVVGKNIAKYNIPSVVAINKFYTDTDKEINWLIKWCKNKGYAVEICDSFFYVQEDSAGACQIISRGYSNFI